MIKEIKCETCDEALGTWEKDIFSDEDIEKIRAMMMCSNGHSNAAVLNDPSDAEE